jgi:AAA+ superfamily predicted ATPase
MSTMSELTNSIYDAYQATADIIRQVNDDYSLEDLPSDTRTFLVETNATPSPLYRYACETLAMTIALKDNRLHDEEIEFIMQSLHNVEGATEEARGVLESINERMPDQVDPMEAPTVFFMHTINICVATLPKRNIKKAIEPILAFIERLSLAMISIDPHEDEREINFVTVLMHDLRGHYESALAGDYSVPLSDDLQSEETLATVKKTNIHSMGSRTQSGETLEGLLEELNNLVGLDEVKAEVMGLVNLLRVQEMRKEHGLPIPPMSKHLVFMGNPGTGKTTVARIISNIYKKLGLLSSGHLVEVDRSSLVAGYIGQTAIKTSNILKSALGGILFIDEAYSLAQTNSQDDYGKEAIDTILKYMEDNRDNIVVIVAGYRKSMQKFLDSNPGVRSRFSKYISFDDFSVDQLCNIFDLICAKSGYAYGNDARKIVAERILRIERNKGPTFGNARVIRNFFERALTNHANRVATMSAVDTLLLSTLSPKDIPEIDEF